MTNTEMKDCGILDELWDEIEAYAEAHCSGDSINVYDVAMIIGKYRSSDGGCKLCKRKESEKEAGESNDLTKGKLFSASVRCPKCGKAIHMRVSNNPEYAYQCMECDEDFYSSECHETVSDCYDGKGNYFSLWEITLRNKDAEWYKKNHDILDQICGNYNVSFMCCDYIDREDALIDFGWKEPPSEKQIQEFTDEIIKIL